MVLVPPEECYCDCNNLGISAECDGTMEHNGKQTDLHSKQELQKNDAFF